MNEEQWKPVRGYEGLYKVSNQGRVFGIKTSTHLRACDDGKGYPLVNLSKQGKQKTWHVHRLVALAFLPNPDNRPHAAHRNGIRSDNRSENLRWSTIMENEADKLLHGTVSVGEKNGASKLKLSEVVEIKSALRCGKRGIQLYLAKRYGVRTTTINEIAMGRNWSWA